MPSKQSQAEGQSMLREQINESVKAAMRARDKLRVATLRMVNAAIKNAEIEAERAGKNLSEDDLLSLLQKLIKQRQESLEIYERSGRDDLASQERGEIGIIREFLPQQLSESEARAAAASVIAETGAQGMKDMGKVMAALKANYAGRMDFAKASALVKQLLSANP
jgi:uncharacterized protein YqeY